MSGPSPDEGWKFSTVQNPNENCDNYDPLMMTRVDFGIFNAMNDYGWPMIVPMYNTITQECVEFQIDSWTGFGAPLTYSDPSPSCGPEKFCGWTYRDYRGNPDECMGRCINTGFTEGMVLTVPGITSFYCACSGGNEEQCIDNLCPMLPPDGRKCEYGVPPVCGDGKCSITEKYSTCSLDCQPICGDGVKQGAEICDHGQYNGALGDCCTFICTAADLGNKTCPDPSTCDDAPFPVCTPTGAPYTCPAIMPEAFCNDGEDNDCDNKVDCADNDCASQDICPAVCGDRITKMPPEVCDTNYQMCGPNMVTRCSATCDGYGMCGPNGICGNGMTEGNEECDDGNLNNGDGCTGVCVVECSNMYYLDNDNDGFGSLVYISCSPDAPPGYSILAGDCNDANPSINPAGFDNYCNNLDDNCNGRIDEYVPDPDGDELVCHYDNCPMVYNPDQTNSNPGIPVCTVYAAPEIWPQLPMPMISLDQICREIYPSCIPDPLSNTCTCNGLMCQAIVPHLNPICTDFGALGSCTQSGGNMEGDACDCNDGICDGRETCQDQACCTPSTEVCDGIDNDCDPLIDEDLNAPTTCGLGICSSNAGELQCVNGIEINTCDPLAGAVPESCDDNTGYDGLDNNCDGTIDLDCDAYCDQDGDGYSSKLLCLFAYSLGECNDEDASINPGAQDVSCDGVDNNCNGLPDEQYPITPTSCGIGECASSGVFACINAEAKDTCTPGTQTLEICDGLDNDCDGAIDEEDQDYDGVPDCNDACINVAGISSRQGCPYGELSTVMLHYVDQAKTGICGTAGSCKVALNGAIIKVFNRNDAQFQALWTKNPSGDKYAQVYENAAGKVGTCTTGADGKCTAGTSMTGDFLIIVKYYDISTGKTVYTGLPASSTDFVSGLVTKDFQILKTIKKDLSIQWSGGSKVVITGSMLEVVYPSDVEWTDGSYVYPYIFTSADDWSVDVCAQVPTGYDIVGVYDLDGNLVTTQDCTQVFVAGQTKVVAFEVKDIGSPDPNMKMILKAKHGKGPVKQLSLETKGKRLAKGLFK